MAIIEPFGGLRFTPKAGALDQLTCPPYDIISEAEREEYLQRNPHNIIRLELPREGENPYLEAGKALDRWLEEEILACDGEDALYIYKETFPTEDGERSIQGLVCRVKLEEFSKGVVLPHEETLSKAKDDRFRLMCATGCNFSSIYSLYFDPEHAVYSQVERGAEGEPISRFQSGDGMTHALWKLTDPEWIASVKAAMRDKKLYIADGHHRYETGLRYKQHLIDQGEPVDDAHAASYIMMTLVHMEHPGLLVLPTHRVVHSLEGFDARDLLDRCGVYFQVEATSQEEAQEAIARLEAQGKKAFALYTGEGWSLLTLKDKAVMDRLMPERSRAYRELDVSILHTLVLEQLLGIDKENMANQKNLRYSREIAPGVEAVDKGEANCLFVIGPTKVEEIAAVAGAGEKMPQKSTYFHPKLITGAVMNKIL